MYTNFEVMLLKIIEGSVLNLRMDPSFKKRKNCTYFNPNQTDV